MSDKQFQLGFIGAGKLAGSVIRGLILSNYCNADAIIASEPGDEARGSLERDAGIATTASNADVARAAQTIFIGVKPQGVLPVLWEIAPHVANKLVVSFAAGVRIADMENAAPARIARVMTNTPAAIARAATGIATGTRATQDDVRKLEEMFNAIGTAVVVDEREIDAVTALAGSGPAFVYSVIEALASGGAAAGLQSDNALRLAAQMTLGAASLALTSGKSPEELRKMVVTPGGTTAAGLAVLQERNAGDAIAAAVEAAAARGREMSREFGS